MPSRAARVLFWSTLVYSSFLLLGRLAVGEERVGHNLGGLSPCHLVVGAEVGAVVRGNTWLRVATAVATDSTRRGQSFYPLPEGATPRHVLEGPLPRRWSR